MTRNYYFPQQNNPYMNRMDFLQTYQQPTMVNQPMNVLGKYVDSEDIVKATDIPMDGNIYYFPKADGSAIYGKQWLVNGQTRILTYKPTLDTNTDNSTQVETESKIGANNEATKGILDKIDNIDSKLEVLLSNFQTKSTRSAKKESAVNE